MGEEVPKPRKIFISYGRKDAIKLAFQLEEDLRKKGHEVWLDKREIEPGESWEQQIEEGVLNAEIFVALLSPHAVRRPDGVCLDEISYARYNGRKILPAMVLMCRPPLGIYRLDWINFQNWENETQYSKAFNRLLEAIEKKEIVEGYYSRIFSELDDPLDFGVEIARHIHDFTGREWLVQELNEWLENESSRVFFITGDPGIGKSAIMAYLIEKHPQVIAHHFCINNLKDSLNVIRFIKSIAAQLATQLENYREALNTVNLEELITIGDPEVIFRRIIADPLKSENPDTPLLIVVDGLDEGLTEKSPNIISVLRHRLNDLPQWVRLVLSSRKKPEILDLFSEFQPRTIDASRSENVQDINTYIEKKLKDSVIKEKILEKGLNTDEVGKVIARKGEGNFLYIINVIKAIKDGLLDPRYPEAFPPGLIGIYKLFFERIFPNVESYRNYRPILDVIITAREPLTAEQVGSFLKLDTFDIEQDLQKLSIFFPERDQCYRAYHKSLTEWLSGEIGSDRTYRVNVEGGHRLITNRLLESYRESEMDRYLLAHLPQHLLILKKWDNLATVLTDLNYIESCLTKRVSQNLLKNYLDILASEEIPDDYRKKIQEFKQFVFNQAHILRKYPNLTIQQALNQPDITLPSEAGKYFIKTHDFSRLWKKYD